MYILLACNYPSEKTHKHNDGFQGMSQKLHTEMVIYVVFTRILISLHIDKDPPVIITNYDSELYIEKTLPRGSGT